MNNQQNPKKYLFHKNDIVLISYGDNRFMASCYANDYLKNKKISCTFNTWEAIELGDELEFGVAVSIVGGNLETFDAENPYFKISDQNKKIHITENGQLMDGSEKVTIPECYVMATSYMDAVNILNTFLKTKVLSEDITLITPLEKIAFYES